MCMVFLLYPWAAFIVPEKGQCKPAKLDDCSKNAQACWCGSDNYFLHCYTADNSIFHQRNFEE